MSEENTTYQNNSKAVSYQQDGSTSPAGSSAVKCHEMTIALPNNLRVAAKHWGSKTAPIKTIALHGWLGTPPLPTFPLT